MIPYNKEEGMFVVCVTCEEEMLYNNIVFALRKPFLANNKKEAEEYAEMLSSINPHATYKVYKLEEA